MLNVMDLDTEKWGTLLGWPDGDSLSLADLLQDPSGAGEFTSCFPGSL